MDIMAILTQAINEGTIPFLIRQTLIYAVPLMVVALAGVFSERSGVINLALEGIMIFGAFVGVLFVSSVESVPWFKEAYDGLKAMATIKPDAREAGYTAELLGHLTRTQGFALLTMLVTALACAAFAMLIRMLLSKKPGKEALK